MHFSTLCYVAILMAAGASAQGLSDLIPKEWLEARNPLSAIHLGDDGVVRRMVTEISPIARRDDYVRDAQWEVKDAMPLAPQEVRRWLDTLAPHYSRRDNQHFEDVFAAVNGRHVSPEEQMDPPRNLRLRSLGTLEDAREIQRRSEGGRVTKRTGCRGNGDCTAPFRCVILDMMRTGTCVR